MFRPFRNEIRSRSETTLPRKIGDVKAKLPTGVGFFIFDPHWCVGWQARRCMIETKANKRPGANPVSAHNANRLPLATTLGFNKLFFGYNFRYGITD